MSVIGAPYRPTPDVWIIAHGDSITQGVGTTNAETKSYPFLLYSQQTAAHSSTVYTEINYGINGQGLNYIYGVAPSNSYGTLTQDAVTRIDPFLAQSGTKYLIIFAGTNDIFLNSISGANTWTLLLAYINARISAGWAANRICVVTMLPRQGSHESDRTAYNGAIRSNQGSMGYLIADAAANSTLGDAGDKNNATYYADTIHLTDSGQAVLAGIISAQLFA